MDDRAVAPDRGMLLTEQRLAASARLDALDAAGVLSVIHEQDRTIADILGQAIPQLAPLVDTVVDAMGRGGRLIYVGAGTSGRLGVLDASEIPPTFNLEPGRVVGVIAGGEPALTRSSEGREDDPAAAATALAALNLHRDDVVLGIAAGGTTPFVLGAIDAALDRGAPAGLLTCVSEDHARAALGRRQVRHLICLPVGPEVVTGSTRMKAGTATKLALNMISTAAMVRLGKTWGNLMVDLRASNAKLRDRAIRILQSQQPTLPRDAALRLLDAADGRVKLALVMLLRPTDRPTAEALLTQSAGHLRPILGEPR